MSPELDPSEKFSDFGLELSLRFDQCSMSAAEACKTAEKHMAVDLPVEKLTLIDNSGSDEPRQFALAGTMRRYWQRGETESHEDRADIIDLAGRNPAKLVVAQEVKEVIEKGNTVEQTRGILLRKTVSVPQPDKNVTKRVGDPLLALKLEDSIILPLASFAKRTGGKCSYVQVGSEMYDDNFHTTLADDKTSRLDIVETFRKILNPSRKWRDHSGPDSLDEESMKVVNSLIESESDRFEAQINAAYERHLTEYCLELVKKEGESRDLVIAGHDMTTENRTLKTYTIMSPGVLEDGRVANLVIAYSEGSPNHVELISLSRGNVGVKLGTMSAHTGKFQLEHSLPGAEAENHLDLIHRLLMLVKNGIPLPPEDTNCTYELEKDSDMVLYAAAQELGLVHSQKIEGSYDSYNYREKVRRTLSGAGKKQEIAEARIKLNKALCYSGLDNPLSKSTVWQTIQDGHSQRNKHRQDILEVFDVDLLFDQLTGKTSTDLESMVTKLIDMGREGETFQGTLHDVPTESVRISIDTQVRINRDGSNYHVQIFGRPSAMEGDNYELIDRLDLNLAGPNDENGRLLAKAKKICPILEAVRVVKPASNS